jgi:AcrR family transcriptional regulator
MKKRPSPLAGSFDRAVVKSQVTDEKLVAKRREQIVSAAIELFSEQGYYVTTVLDIARKAGVSAGLIYQYAQTKEDVLLLSLVTVLESYKQEIPRSVKATDDPIQALWNSLDAYCRVIDRRRSAAVLAYRSTKSLPRPQREIIKRLELETNEYLADRLRDCVSAGLFREINVDLVTYQLVLYAHAWALKHWRLGAITTIDGYIEQGFDFFVHAMATPKGLVDYGRFLSARPPKSARLAGKRKSVRASE